MRFRTTMAVAALTTAAAIAIQWHLHRRRIRAIEAAALTERLARERAHEAYAHDVGVFVSRVVADAEVVDAAHEVIDMEWHRNQQHQQGEGDEGDV